MGKKDITLKDYFSDCRRYADLLNGSIFCGRQMIKADELRDADTVQSKSDRQEVLERTNDIAMKQIKDGNIFAVWALSKMLNINAEKLRNKAVRREEGASDMCRAIEELIADGRAEGKIEGRVEGKEEGKTEGLLEGDAARIIKSIESVMKNLKVEAARACEIIGVTVEEYQKAKEVTALPL